MNKIINGKRYNTETAKALASYSYSNRMDFHFFEETLYQKSTGEFFLYGIGGAASKYARSIEQNTWAGGEKIMPLSVDNARAWAEKYLTGDEYEEIFGIVEESNAKKSVTFSLDDATISKIKLAAASANMTLSDYITQLVNAQ